MTGTAGFLYFEMKSAAKQIPPKNIPFLIVLGAKVNGSVMSKALYQRAVTALHYLKENPETKVVVTGGKGAGENISEGEALARYFKSHRISKSRILVENHSVSTYENILFASNKYHFKQAVIVSNDFHVYRAVQLAKANGIKFYPLAAKTPPSVKGKLYFREMLAIIKWRITGK